MNKYIKITLLLFLVLMLFLVRKYALDVFYDPLIMYFKNDYLYSSIPKVHIGRLIRDMFFRYSINSLISLGILWLLFKRVDYLKFSTLFLMLAFVLLIVTFYFLIRNQLEDGYLLAFYIRRFIIHPLFLLLLVPAFYYQKLSNT